MVKIAEERGISEVARAYGTTRNTVRKWLLRFLSEGLEGLKDKRGLLNLFLIKLLDTRRKK